MKTKYLFLITNHSVTNGNTQTSSPPALAVSYCYWCSWVVYTDSCLCDGRICQQFEVNHSESVYTTELSTHYKSELITLLIV